MAKTDKKILEKNYRDELKSIINRLRKVSEEGYVINFKEEEINIYKRVYKSFGYDIEQKDASILDKYELNLEELNIGIATEIFLKRYDDINDEQLKNIIGSHLFRYAFLRTMIKESNNQGESLTDSIRSNGVEHILKYIGNIRKTNKEQNALNTL